jgi:hypothetical protein
MRMLLQKSGANTASTTLYDCGPLMNRILIEALAHLHLRPSFEKTLFVENEQREAFERDGNPTAIVLERWDYRIVRGENLDALREILLETRDAIASLLKPWSCCGGDQAEGKHLILQRSAEPTFYQAGGGARRETYGLGRRSFLGIKEGHAQLEALGIPCLTYEPGIHNLACQINHFSACAGIIGVRGAEFANVVWMPASTNTFMFMSNSLPGPDASHQTLARLLGHIYLTIPHEGEANPVLDVSRITEHLLPKTK